MVKEGYIYHHRDTKTQSAAAYFDQSVFNCHEYDSFSGNMIIYMPYLSMMFHADPEK